MYTLFAHLVQLLAPARGLRRAAVPRQLLEIAGARAGADPHQAEDLRRAAIAYLRVVR